MCKFWHMWTCLSGKFPLFAHCERTMRCVHCKTTCVYITFRLTIIITLCFAPTFPSIYLNSHTTMWLFYLQILFNIPLFSMSFESVKPMFSDIVSCVKSLIERRVRKLKSCGGTAFRLQMWVVTWKRWCHVLNVTHRHVFVSQKVCQWFFGGQSAFFLVVAVSLRGQSFFVDGVYILWWLCTRIYWDISLGKPRSMSGQMYGGG